MKVVILLAFYGSAVVCGVCGVNAVVDWQMGQRPRLAPVVIGFGVAVAAYVASFAVGR